MDGRFDEGEPDGLSVNLLKWLFIAFIQGGVNMFFRQMFDQKLSQFTYLMGCSDTGKAILIDPQRDIQQYLTLAEAHGFRITAVAETHVHSNFLSGAREVAARLGAQVYLSGEGEHQAYNWNMNEQEVNDQQMHFLEDGDAFFVGNLKIRAFHTPGHTAEHLSYLVTDSEEESVQPIGMISGDFVLVNEIGRPDMQNVLSEGNGIVESYARLFYKSIQRFLYLPDSLQIWPGHGDVQTGERRVEIPQSTAGYEKGANPMIQLAKTDRKSFLDTIKAGGTDPPAYFSRMNQLNREGAPILGKLPRPEKLSTDELVKASKGVSSKVIDTRIDSSAFMLHHLKNGFYAPMNQNFNRVIGTLMENEPRSLVLIVEEHDLEEAVRDLVRIGFDRIEGFVERDELYRGMNREGMEESIEEIDFDRMETIRSRPENEVLDVRFRQEFQEGHVPGAMNRAYTRLPGYGSNFPADKTYLVYSNMGERSAVSAAYLQRRGYDVKYVSGVLHSFLE